MATYNERKDFIKDLIHDDLLDMAIDWIKKSMMPSEVFSDEQLSEWAEDHGYIKDGDQ